MQLYFSDKQHAQVLAELAKLAPDTVELDLRSNILGLKSGDELIAIIRALPVGLESLDLSWNHLGNKSGEELVLIMQALPAGLQSLNLNSNALDKKADEELIEILNVFRDRELRELMLYEEWKYNHRSILDRPAVRTVFDSIIRKNAHNANQKASTLFGTFFQPVMSTYRSVPLLPVAFECDPSSLSSTENPTPNCGGLGCLLQ